MADTTHAERGYVEQGNRPWRGDTVAQVAATTKGATAICAHLP